MFYFIYDGTQTQNREQPKVADENQFSICFKMFFPIFLQIRMDIWKRYWNA